MEELQLENTQQGVENYNPGIAPAEEHRTALGGVEHHIALGEEHHTVLGEVGHRIGHEVPGIHPAEGHRTGVVGLQGPRIVVLGDQERGMLAQGGHMTHLGYMEDWAMASRAHRIGQIAGGNHNHNSAVAEELVCVAIIC